MVGTTDRQTWGGSVLPGEAVGVLREMDLVRKDFVGLPAAELLLCAGHRPRRWVEGDQCSEQHLCSGGAGVPAGEVGDSQSRER